MTHGAPSVVRRKEWASLSTPKAVACSTRSSLEASLEQAASVRAMARSPTPVSYPWCPTRNEISAVARRCVGSRHTEQTERFSSYLCLHFLDDPSGHFLANHGRSDHQPFLPPSHGSSRDCLPRLVQADASSSAQFPAFQPSSAIGRQSHHSREAIHV